MLVTKTLTKKGLEIVINESFSNFGNVTASSLLDSLKFLGFYYSTTSGLSITIDDLKTPEEKNTVLQETNEILEQVSLDWYKGLVSDTERFQRIITSWNMATESLKNRIIDYYKKFDPANSLYIMAFSGARGNISQVRQLIGMRGLMADQAGKIINLPIQANFREGLSSIDYIVSSYGARKGIVDTALKTADSGYLTRRLIYLARNVIIKKIDCGTKEGLWIIIDQKTSSQSLLGKTIISKDIIDYSFKGQIFTERLLQEFQKEIKIKKKEKIILKIRSPLTCNFSNTLCQLCYGWDLGKRSIISLGEAVGIVAAQSIGEPGTQLTMRTFHTGGIFTGEMVEQRYSPLAGKLSIPSSFKGVPFRTLEGRNVLKVDQDLPLFLTDWKGKTHEIFLEGKSYLYVLTGDFLKKNQVIAEIPKKNISSDQLCFKPIYSPLDGQIFLEKDKHQKGNIFWILSGKVYVLPKYTNYLYPKILDRKKSIAKLKVITPNSGIVKINQECLYFQTILPYLMTPEIEKENLNQKITQIKNILRRLILYIFKYPDKEVENNFEDNLNKFIKVYFEGFSYKKFIKTFLFFFIGIKESFLFLKPQAGHKKKKLIKNYKINKVLLLQKIIELQKYLKKEEQIQNYESIIPDFLKINKNFSSPYGLFKIPLNFLRKPQGNLSQKFDSIVKNYQYLDSHTVFGFTSFYPKTDGKIYSIKIKTDKKNLKQTHFFLTESDIWTIHSDQMNETFSTSSRINKKIIERGNLFASTIKSLQSGILLRKDGFRFLFQKAQPIFFPRKTKIKYEEEEFVKKGKLLARLKYYTQQTEDIVQGLPKIEQMLEARKKLGQTAAIFVRRPGIFLHNQFLRKSNFILSKEKKEVSFENIFEPRDQVPQKNRQKEEERRGKKMKRRKLDKTYTTLKSYSEVKPLVLKEINWDVIKGKKANIFYSPLTLRQFVSFQGKAFRIRYCFPKNHLKKRFNQEKSQGHLYFYRKKVNFSKKKIYWMQIYGLKTQYLCAFLNSDRKPVYFRLKAINAFKDMSAQITNHGKFLDFLEIQRKGKIPLRLLLEYLFRYQVRFSGVAKGSLKASKKFQLILLNSIQAIYSSQGVSISNKHLEIMTRQMLSKGAVKKPGYSPFRIHETVDLAILVSLAKRCQKINRNLPFFAPHLRSTTKSALGQKGFLSNAGFQETKRILLTTALHGRRDWLRGLKESVITGRIIPAGSSFSNFKHYLNTIFKIREKEKVRVNLDADIDNSNIFSANSENYDELTSKIQKDLLEIKELNKKIKNR